MPCAGSEGRWCSLQKHRRCGLKAQLTCELKKAENAVVKQVDTTLNLCAPNLQESKDGLQVVLKTEKLYAEVCLYMVIRIFRGNP